MFDYIKSYKKGSSIHIKKSHEGRFTDYCGGNVTSECIKRGKNSPDPKIRKMATFAKNARVWKHYNGGDTSIYQLVKNDKYGVSSIDATENPIYSTSENTKVSMHPWQENVIGKVSSMYNEEDDASNTDNKGWESDDKYSYTELDGNTSSLTEDLTSIKTKPVSLSTSSKANAKTIMSYIMKELGLTKAQAAGVVGVLQAESSLNPGAVNQEEARLYGTRVAGGGIAQWTGSRNNAFREWMKQNKGKDLGPAEAGLDAQLEYMVYEMLQRPAFLKALKSSTSVEDATDAMYRGYENGSNSALSTKESIINIYTPAWQKTYGGKRKFNYDDELGSRISYSRKAFELD